MDRSWLVSLGALLFALSACSDPTASLDAAGLDAGDTLDGGALVTDAGATDAGADVDAAMGDSGSGGDDAGAADPDSGASDGGAGDAGASCAGMECPDYAAALAAAPRGATGLDNCVVQLHRSDCCGAMDANGVNHAARTTLCPAEAACVATYPTDPGCSDATLTTDTGETTTSMDDVRLRIVEPTPCTFDPAVTCYRCETFVCTSGPCRSAPGIAGGCG